MPAAIEERVALAVLPLRDLSSAQNQSHLAVGFTEDLLTELTRLSTLDVHHGHAILQATGDADVDTDRARELGIAYALRGSVRRDESTIRVNAQLLETESGRVTWAETLDRPIENLFEVQDEIVARVAAALSVHLDDRLLDSARRRPLGGLTTYECWLSGVDCLRRGTLEADEEARTYFERALELDPEYARAWAGLSLSHFNEWSCQVWHLFEENENGAFDNAVRAAELDDGDAVVQLVLGQVRVFRREFDAGRRALERALALHPNDPEILAHLGLLLCNLGEPNEALQMARKAQQLNPRHPTWYCVGEAMALYLLGRYDEALDAAVRTDNAFVDAPVLRAAASAMLGDEAEAKRQLAEFQREFKLKITFGREPDTGEMLDWLVHVNPFRRDEDAALLLAGLAKAGLSGAGPEPLPAPTKTPRALPPDLPLPGNVLRRQAETWTVAFDGHGAQVSELKGFHDLARLLSSPNTEIHCLELRGSPGNDDHGTEVLDRQAQREIEERVEELSDEVRVAEENHDLGRAERGREELEILHSELSKAFGLGGRQRRMGDEAEKARTAVTWRIRAAIKKLKVVHPRLGRHLERSVRTGTFCVYSPEVPVHWQVEIAA